MNRHGTATGGRMTMEDPTSNDDIIEKISDVMCDNARKLMLFFDKLRDRGVGFTGVTFRDKIQGANYRVIVELDEKAEDEE